MSAMYRSISIIIGAILCAKITSYVYSRNQMADLYPSEADSISIPILMTQFILATLVIILLPSMLLGNKKFKKWTKSGTKLKLICVSVIALVGYLLAAILELAIVSSGVDENHWEISASMTLLVGCTVYFLFNDIKWILSNSDSNDDEKLIKNQTNTS